MSENGDWPLVSIITPVYNGSQYLEELILSVHSQDYPRIEHIIIDDGSTDEGMTVAVLNRYPDLHWWSRENRGQYATMNEGLEASRGEFVCFISADDLLLPGAVRSAIGYMQNHPACDGVAGLARYMSEDGVPYPIEFPFRTAPVKYYPYFSHIAHCSLYIRRDRLLINGLTFDSSLHYNGDYDWILRIIKKLNIKRLNLYFSKVRIHPAQGSVLYRESMIQEHQDVVKAHHLNPVLYLFFTGLFILVHNARKLQDAWSRGGVMGAWQLISNRYSRHKLI